MKIYLKEITLLLFKIYSFIELKVLLSLPKFFHGPLDYENALQLAHWPCYWSLINWVKQAENTVSVQWSLTVCILSVNSCHGSKKTTLNHLIASWSGICDWPLGASCWNLRHLKMYPRTYYGHCWNLSIFDSSRDIWVFFRKGCLQKIRDIYQ